MNENFLEVKQTVSSITNLKIQPIVKNKIKVTKRVY